MSMFMSPKPEKNQEGPKPTGPKPHRLTTAIPINAILHNNPNPKPLQMSQRRKNTKDNSGKNSVSR